MKLIRCFVENFGTLSKESMEFESGLCCTYKENGSGKTTLAVFIKAMLFGLEVSTKKDLDKNERNKYRPWNGLSYGGWIEFYSDSLDKSFRVTRFFADKASLDTCEIIDLSTGLDASELFEKGQIGQKLFGIDETGFEQTLFLSEKDVEIKNNGSITTKISALASGDDDSFEKAVKILDTKRKYYKNSAGRGKLADLEEELVHKKNEYDSVLAQSENISAKENEVRDQQERINACEAHLDKATELLEKLTLARSAKEKKLNLDTLQNKLELYKKRRSDASAPYKSEFFNALAVRDVEDKIAELEVLSARGAQQQTDSLKMEVQSLEKKLWDVKIPKEDVPVAIEKYHFSGNLAVEDLKKAAEKQKTKLDEAARFFRKGVLSDESLASLKEEWAKIERVENDKYIITEKIMRLSRHGAVSVSPKLKKDTKKYTVWLFATCAAALVLIFLALAATPIIFVPAILLAAAAVFFGMKFGKCQKSVKEIMRRNEDLNQELIRLNVKSEDNIYKMNAYTKIYDEALIKLGINAGIGFKEVVDRNDQYKQLKNNYEEAKSKAEEKQNQEKLLMDEFKELVGSYADSFGEDTDPKSILISLSADFNRLLDKKERLEAAQNAQKELEKEISCKFEAVLSGISALFEDEISVRDIFEAKAICKQVSEDIRDCDAASASVKALEEEIVNASAAMGDTSAIEDLLSMELEDISENIRNINDTVKKLRNEIEDLKIDMERKKASIETMYVRCEEMTGLEQDICALEEKIAILSSENFVVCTALDHLEKAKNSLSSRYVKAIEENFKGLVTTSDNQSVKLDTKLSMKVEKEGQLREMACFSRGQRDVIDFSLRMALVKTLFEGGERPFIILDDPFSALDKNNFEKAADTVRELSKDYQIIYTVCAEERAI